MIKSLLAQSPKRPIRAVGIDLGTTNSSAAVVEWEPGEEPVCRVIEIDQPTREGTYTSPLVPSVVAVTGDGREWVGEGAKRMRGFLQDYGLAVERDLFYDTKNEMGLRKTYYRAAQDLNHASKIAGRILGFMNEAAARDIAGQIARTSVTVPASFRLNQRRDTLQACGLAGLRLRDDDLLDEPTAALIDYVAREGVAGIFGGRRSALCLVFDFGGGTCDVSVIEISRPDGDGAIEMSQLSVSRYHRLGGGDIDAAIVHERLIPALLRENGLDPLRLSWAQKKKGLEPQLLAKAEALKKALCLEIDRLRKFGKWDTADKSAVRSAQPALVCRLPGLDLPLSSPSLTAAEFEEILKPFLDTDLLYARETEYRLSQSVFAPLHDALERADRDPDDVEFVLMAGGSSLIPQVRDAVRGYFPNAALGAFEDALEMQLAVARGAAWDAAVRAATSRPLIRQVLHDGIALVTQTGALLPLIPAKSPLPFPEDGSFLREPLRVPDSLEDRLEFRMVGESDRQLVESRLELPEWVDPGDGITLEYRVTAGKQFECRAYLTDRPTVGLEISVENPLVNVLDPHADRVKIEEAEEELRGRGGGTAADLPLFMDLAGWYRNLNQREKALDCLRTALNKVQWPHPGALNMQGILLAELGDLARAEKAYREAYRSDPSWDGPMFNLALALSGRGQVERALEALEEAMSRTGLDAAGLAFMGELLLRVGRDEEGRAAVARSLRMFGPPAALSDWHFNWYTHAVQLTGDADEIRKVKAAAKARRKKRREGAGEEMARPALWGADAGGGAPERGGGDAGGEGGGGGRGGGKARKGGRGGGRPS